MEQTPPPPDNAPNPANEILVTQANRRAGRHEARLDRVRDYQVASLEKADELESNLGSINSGLMRMALWLDEAIEQAMESGPLNVERIQELMPAIDVHLRVARQVDRLAQLERRMSQSPPPKATQVGAPNLSMDDLLSAAMRQSEDLEI